MSHVDTILYKKIGRADEMPIASFVVGSDGIGEQIAAIKAAHINDAIRSGSQMPVFRVESGHTKSESK